MRVFKSVWQHYTPTPEIPWLLEQFRQMLNDCIQIGLAENVTSLKSLSLKAYKQLNCYNVYSRHKLCAISAAAGILRSYRKAKRKNPGIKEPHARRLRLTTCYGFEIQDGELVLPVRAREYVRIPLNRHVQVAIAGFKVRSMTLTEDRLCLDYANDISEIRPQGFIGIDRNLDNVTIAMSDGSFKRLELSEATRTKAVYLQIRSRLKRNDVRIRRQVSGKYGRKQRDKVQQIFHHASKLIIEEAKSRQYGLVMEKLTGIRRLYRRGNWQGRWYRGRMNSWSYAELQRQIEYKAKWEGLPVIYVHPHGTSSKCSICGGRMRPEENRLLRCLSCGYTVDRDVNAARNLAARGLKFGPVGLAVEAMVTASATVRESAKSMRGS